MVAFGLSFQHLPRDLANVNTWKTMFDPYNKSNATSEDLVCTVVSESSLSAFENKYVFWPFSD